MSVFLVAPAEPPDLRAIGTTAGIAEEYGADILIPSPLGFIGVQRKQFPNDFLSSLADGRLHTSLVKLTKCDMRILLLEGRPAWTTSGFLVSDYVQFSRVQLRNLLMSAHWELGVHSVWTDSISDTIDTLRDIARWAEKPRHDSLFVRANQKDPHKRQWSTRDKAVFILQGFDGLGPELAGRVYDKFGRIPLRWDVTDDELEEVDGIGPGRIARMRDVVK